jgi:hypothetical protein
MKSRDRANQSQHDMIQFNAIADLFNNDNIDLIERIEAFPRYITHASMSKFLTRYEIFKRVLPVHGSIIECGVLHGAGLFTWAKLSTIFEPTNHTRRIIGFDTFEGFQEFHEKDKGTPFKPGDLKGLSAERTQAAIDCYDLNRPLAHIPKVEIVKGDLCKTAETYCVDHPELVVAMLYLDVDLYEPTMAALNEFVPLMPKGAIIVFDEANYRRFPGETQALWDFQDRVGVCWRLERHPFQSMVSFAVLD